MTSKLLLHHDPFQGLRLPRTLPDSPLLHSKELYQPLPSLHFPLSQKEKTEQREGLNTYKHMHLQTLLHTTH